MKLLLTSVALLFATISVAQSYTFSSFIGGYTDLAGSTSLNNGAVWDDPTYTIPIGFDFLLFGSPNDSITMDDLGGIVMSSSCTPGENVGIFGYASDIIDRGYDIGTSMSNISYKTEGPVGTRIFKLEWFNVGFYEGTQDASTGVYIDNMSYQLWLYESTNVIEFHFGASSVAEPLLDYEGFPGPIILLYGMPDCGSGDNGEALILEGAAVAPIMNSTLDIDDTIVSLDGTPGFGAVYRFGPATGTIDENWTEQVVLNVVPNPANDEISLLIDGVNDNAIEQVTILNTEGRVVKSIDSYQGSINISDLESGVYLIQMSSEVMQTTSRFIKL